MCLCVYVCVSLGEEGRGEDGAQLVARTEELGAAPEEGSSKA